MVEISCNGQYIIFQYYQIKNFSVGDYDGSKRMLSYYFISVSCRAHGVRPMKVWLLKHLSHSLVRNDACLLL